MWMCATIARRWKSELRIAVIIVNWNAGSHLQRALAALAAQHRLPDRVIVLDNASTDGSIDAARRSPACEVIGLDRNRGFAEGNNIAARAASDCDWLAFLNPDAFPDADWLGQLTAAAAAHPNATMFASELRMAGDPTKLDGAGDAYHVCGLAWRVGHGHPAPEADDVREVFSPCAAAALVRHDAFDEVGGFDTGFFCYAEDVDLAFRLRLRGHRCLYIPGARVLHVGAGTTSARSAFAIYHGHRNLVWTWVKNMPGWWLLWYAPQHALLTVMSIARFASIGHGRTIVRAKWDALIGLRRALVDRRRIQRARVVPPRAVLAAMTHGWLTPYRHHLRRRF
jgi:GT2 family glycosyltransferase